MNRCSVSLVLPLVLVLAAGCRDRDPNLPIVIVGTPGDAGGRAVSIAYVLRSQDTSAVSIRPQWSVRKGRFADATPAPGGEGTTRLDATPGGVAHTFLWDAVADLGPGRHEEVLFRIDVRGNGTSDVTARFVVDNTDIFVRVDDQDRARTEAAAAETPEGGTIVAGGASLSLEAELFDPVAATFTARGVISTPRDGPEAAALLALEGGLEEPRPVLMGGEDGTGNALDAIDVFDPGPGGFAGAGPLGDARTGHTVTRLASGDRALVAGGTDAGAAVSPDEVFAIDTGAVTAVSGALQANRARHTATLLPDGRVFIAGGIDAAGNVTASSLVYDPALNSYSAGPDLIVPREGHAAALVGGRVAVFGGRDATGAVLRSGEIADAGLTAFDLTRDLTGAAIEMTSPRADFTATPLGTTQVLLVAGTDGAQSIASAERFVFDPQSGAGAYVATRDGLSVARRGHEAVLFGTGRVLIVGGGSSAAEVYYPPSRAGAQTFDPEGSGDPAARAEHAGAGLRDGRALVTGGTSGIVEGGERETLATAEIYEPAARAPLRRVRAIEPMLEARRRHTATLLLDDRVLVAGGVDAAGDPLDSAEIFDPDAIATSTRAARPGAVTWTAVPDPLPLPLGGHTATRVPSGLVVLAGGRTAGGVVTDAIVLFDPAGSSGAGDFALASVALAEARERHTATLLADGRVLFAGGLDAGGAALASAEVYDPETDTIAPAPALGAARFDHAAARLGTDEVLVAGGRGTPGGAPLASVDLYAPDASSRASGGTLDEGRADFAMLASGGRVLIAGGVVGAAPSVSRDLASPLTASAVIYNPAANGGAGETTPALDRDLARARRGMVVLPIAGGRFLLWGGRAETGAAVPGIEATAP